MYGAMRCFEDAKKVLDKSNLLSIKNMHNPKIKNLRNNAKKIHLFDIVDTYVNYMTNILKIVLFGIIIFYYRCQILLVFIIIVFFIRSVLQKKYGAGMEKFEQQQFQSKRVIEYIFALLSRRESLQEIRTYKNNGYLNHKRSNIFEGIYKARIKMVWKNEHRVLAIDSVITVCNLLSTCLLVIICSYNSINPGAFVVLMQIMTQIYDLIYSITNNYRLIQGYKIQYSEYNNYLMLDEVDEIKISDKNTNPWGVIIKDVVFSYPDSEVKALDSISIHIKAGQKVSLVGANGSGKSTLVKMILGVYTPDEGSVNWVCDEKVLNSNGICAKCVFQDFVKLLRPLRENVAMGDITKIRNDSIIKNVLNNANVFELSSNLEQYIGPEFGGVELSGGQWQKVSIARAYMKDANIAVFDEATSALDAKAELQQCQAFFELGHNLTSIIVTHRLSITKFVDTIFVVDKGKIVETGNHDELYKKGGLYRKMYDSQSAFYV